MQFPLIRHALLLGMVLSLAACGGSSDGGSAGPPTTSNPTIPVAWSIAVNSGDGQTGSAGTKVPINPSVIVRDAGGHGVAGIGVTFAVTSGGGSATGTSQTTNSSGIATVGSWTLGAVASTNLLTATSNGLSGSPVTFTATATGPAVASLVKVAGDNQVAQPGSAVSPGPTVRAIDGSGNPMAGVTVTFSVTSGGGQVTGATQVTNGSGIATIGSWTLGPANGTPVTNTIVASVGNVSTFFNGNLPASCTKTTVLIPSSTTNGSFAAGTGSCQINGHPTDYYSLTLTQPSGAYRFTAQAQAFSPAIRLSTASGTPAGQNEAPFSNAVFGSLLPAGNYLLQVSTGFFGSNATGSYTIVNIPTTTPAPLSQCNDQYYTLLTSTVWNRSLDFNVGCSEPGFVRVYLTGGQHFTTYAKSSVYTPRLNVRDANNTVLATTLSGIFDMAAPSSGYYTIEVTSENGQPGAFTLYVGPPQ